LERNKQKDKKLNKKGLRKIRFNKTNIVFVPKSQELPAARIFSSQTKRQLNTTLERKLQLKKTKKYLPTIETIQNTQKSVALSDKHPKNRV
jgi:hypothetical protein